MSNLADAAAYDVARWRYGKPAGHTSVRTVPRKKPALLMLTAERHETHFGVAPRRHPRNERSSSTSQSSKSRNVLVPGDTSKRGLVDRLTSLPRGGLAASKRQTPLEASSYQAVGMDKSRPLDVSRASVDTVRKVAASPMHHFPRTAVRGDTGQR